ncbi:diacylglycerol/lipid kinase family protein [Planctomycetota bacterium]
MKFLLIMNPGAHSGRVKHRWQTWTDSLHKNCIEFDSVQTESIGHACKLARSANGCDGVVAVGGDGTINEVLDGVIQSNNPNLCMGVLYAGTSPDFCRFHGIPTDPQRALQVLLAGKTRKVDVARISYGDKAGATHTAHFGCSCNIGMGASVARNSNRLRRFLGDRLGTAVAVLMAVTVNNRVDLELEIDGETHSLPKINNLSIVKNPHIASGLKLKLDIQPDDGKLWLVGLQGKGRVGLCRTLPGFYSGSVTRGAGIYLNTCKRVTIQSQENQEIEFDGDPKGFLPIRIELLPKALNLIGDSYE